MNQHYPFEHMPLPYGYDGLEPYIGAQTVKLHHDRHLQTYVDNLNKTLKDYPQLHGWTLDELIIGANTLPYEIADAVRNNAGGVYNHFFYFDGMHPHEEGGEPPEELSRAINERYGSLEALKTELKKTALSVFGSGYAWLILDGNGVLQVITTKNQDNPLESGLCPVMTIDVWEHAYYLKHFNVRVDYIQDWFMIIDWIQAERNYIDCGYTDMKTNRNKSYSH